MPEYTCQPFTVWMIATLVPLVLLFLAYMWVVEQWSTRKYPRLVDDMNRRRAFEGGMLIGGLFGFIILWGYALELICRA